MLNNPSIIACRKQEGGSGMPTNIVNLVSLMKGEQGTVPLSQVGGVFVVVVVVVF